jgi:hypothetical protein
MTSQSVEQAVRNAIKLEIGDDENITFKQKNQLSLKFGLIIPVIQPEELAFWENIADHYAAGIRSPYVR